MTLLTICQQIAGETGAQLSPTVYETGNNDDNARKMLAAARQRAGCLPKGDYYSPNGTHPGNIIGRFCGKEYTFNTANATAAYNLPSDFEGLSGDTWVEPRTNSDYVWLTHNAGSSKKAARRGEWH